MKAVLWFALVIVLGIALGVGVALLRIRSAPWNPKIDEGGGTTMGAVSWRGEQIPGNVSPRLSSFCKVALMTVKRTAPEG